MVSMRSTRRLKPDRQPPRVLSFSAMRLNKVQELIYVDEFHLDPRGNQVIAQAIAQAVRLGSPRVE